MNNNSYLTTIIVTNGPDARKSFQCDIYDIIASFGVTNVAQAQAIKKLLRGGRADKTWTADVEEAIASAQRAIQIGTVHE